MRDLEAERGIRFENVSFRYPGRNRVDPSRARPLHSGGKEPRHRREERRWKDDAHQAAHASLRTDRGPNPARRQAARRVGPGGAISPHRSHLPELQPLPADGEGERGGSAACLEMNDDASVEGCRRARGRERRRARAEGRPPRLSSGGGSTTASTSSGGQWQRLDARAGLHAARGRRARCFRRAHGVQLDAEAEHAVFERFARLTKGRTKHPHLASLSDHMRMADRIVVLEGGKVVEHGHPRRARRQRRSLREALRASSPRLPVA